MKRNILFVLVIITASILYSCKEDSLRSESVIVVNNTTKSAFDNWLDENYRKPYNIDFKYRMEDIEADMKYYLVPADTLQSMRAAKLVKFLCLEAYDEVAPASFMKTYFPKMIHLIGSGAYQNNGTVILGTAEGGLKITLYLINSLDPTNISLLNEYYFKTIHHEFGHILHQTIPYTVDFKKISDKDYLNDSWTSLTLTDALQKGFITPYASKEANEDFVELLAVYVTNSQTTWNAWLTTAGTTGASKIQQKFDIVKNYMKNTWNIDITKLRDVIMRRSGEIGTLNLNTLN